MAAGHPNVNGCMSLLPIPALSDQGCPRKDGFWETLTPTSVFESPRAYHGIKEGSELPSDPFSLALVPDACDGRGRKLAPESAGHLGAQDRASRLAQTGTGATRRADELGSRREAARTCPGRKCSRMSSKSPNVVSNSARSRRSAPPPRKVGCRDRGHTGRTNRMTTTAMRSVPAARASRIRRRHHSASDRRSMWQETTRGLRLVGAPRRTVTRRSATVR